MKILRGIERLLNIDIQRYHLSTKLNLKYALENLLHIEIASI